MVPWSTVTRPVIGAAIAPTTCATSTSRDGREARRRTPVGVDDAALQHAAAHDELRVGARESFSALAGATGSSPQKVTAVGPVRSSFRRSRPERSAASGEGVLEHVQRRALLAQLPAQRRELRHAEAAVVVTNRASVPPSSCTTSSMTASFSFRSIATSSST